jgi:hypothetical protein
MRLNYVCSFLVAVFVGQSAAQTLTSGKTGVQGGYNYEYWKDNNTGTGTMVLGDSGNFSCTWSNISNILFRKGIRPGTKNTIITYSADYKPVGNSYLAVYGWTRNPLVEYYIIESWGTWRPPGGTAKTSITVDGAKYDIYSNSRTGPSIEGNKTFQQYWSVRQQKRTEGVIPCSTHFDAWAKNNMPMGSMYEVSFVVEGYQSSGSADVKMKMATGATAIGSANVNLTAPRVTVRNGPSRIEVAGNKTQAVTFTLSQSRRVALKVFNFLGQELITTPDKVFPAGTHSVKFTTPDLANGIYCCSLIER